MWIEPKKSCVHYHETGYLNIYFLLKHFKVLYWYCIFTYLCIIFIVSIIWLNVVCIIFYMLFFFITSKFAYSPEWYSFMSEKMKSQQFHHYVTTSYSVFCCISLILIPTFSNRSLVLVSKVQQCKMLPLEVWHRIPL